MTTHSTETTAAPEEKLDFKKILPVFVIVLIDLLGLTIIIPLLPLYAASFGANAFVIGALGAAYPIMQFVGAPILGRLSDRFGRRPVLIISQIGTFVGFLVLGVHLTHHRWHLRCQYRHSTSRHLRQHNGKDPYARSRPDRRGLRLGIHYWTNYCLCNPSLEWQQLQPGCLRCSSLFPVFYPIDLFLVGRNTFPRKTRGRRAFTKLWLQSAVRCAAQTRDWVPAGIDVRTAICLWWLRTVSSIIHS